MTDEEIIQHLRSGNRNKALKKLYKEFPRHKACILKSGGTKQMAEEVFNDALLLLVEKVEQPSFQLTSKLSTFLFGISRFLWMNELRKQNRTTLLTWKDAPELAADDIGYDVAREEKLSRIEAVLDKVSETCRKIFRMFYYEGRAMDDIAQELKFSSVNSAKTQKYKCVEKAIQLSVQLHQTHES